MLYVYCPRKSNGALELVGELGATRLRRFDGLDFWDKKARKRINQGDTIICWGSFLPELDGVRVLNSSDSVDKREELGILSGEGVPCPLVYTGVTPKQLKSAGINALGRMNNHMGGNDLLEPSENPDYYSVKLDIVEEYRIHSFAGRSIRAGRKVLAPNLAIVSENEFEVGVNAHPWIRSYDGGWRIDYSGFKSTPKMRTLASNAVKALGLTFGAVDIAQLRSGALYVLECNRAPGIEGNTIDSYVRAINRWIKKVDGDPEEE